MMPRVHKLHAEEHDHRRIAEEHLAHVAQYQREALLLKLQVEKLRDQISESDGGGGDF